MKLIGTPKYSTLALTCIALLVFGGATVASAGPIPTGWACSGICGTDGVDGIVPLSPTGDSSYEYVTTSGSSASAPLPSGALGFEVNGSSLATPVFSATAGASLNFYFNYVTSDGAGFADYAWAELFDSSNNPVELLFTVRTDPTASIVPGTGLPQPNATLTPASVSINPGGTSWSPLGSSSATCFSGGCGSSGWIFSNFMIVLDGNYYLEVGVTNWLDDTYDSGLAVDGVKVAGTSLLAGPTPEGTTPEPSTLMLLGTGLLAAAGRMLGSSQRKLPSRAE